MIEDYEDPEILSTLSAGNTALIHIIDQNKHMIRLRMTSNTDRHIDVLKTALPTLIQKLEAVNQRLSEP